MTHLKELRRPALSLPPRIGSYPFESLILEDITIPAFLRCRVRIELGTVGNNAAAAFNWPNTTHPIKAESCPEYADSVNNRQWAIVCRVEGSSQYCTLSPPKISDLTNASDLEVVVEFLDQHPHVERSNKGVLATLEPT